MELLHAFIVVVVLVVAAIFIAIVKRQRKPVNSKPLVESLSAGQKNKKRKHFGFGKNKNKKNDQDTLGESLELLKESHEKERKGKQKGKGKGKSAVKAAPKMEYNAEVESDVESADMEEENEQNGDVDVSPKGSNLIKKSQVDKPAEAKQAAAFSGKADEAKKLSDGGELKKPEAEQKGNEKNKPSKKAEDKVTKEAKTSLSQGQTDLIIEGKTVQEKQTSDVILNNRNQQDASPSDPSMQISAKTAKKKKKKNGKSTATNGERIPTDSEANEVIAMPSEQPMENDAKLDTEEDENEGFVIVSREPSTLKTQDDSKTMMNVEKVMDNKATNTMESGKSSSISASTDSNLKEFLLELKKEKEKNEIMNQAMSSLAIQVQEKEAKRVQLERALEYQSAELKNFQIRVQESGVIIQKLEEENHSMKDTVCKVQHAEAQRVAEESLKKDLMQKVRVMDDALQKNSVQLNSSENMRKDLEIRDKRNLERMNMLEMELQGVKSEMVECQKKADERCQGMLLELQKMTADYGQLEKMKNRLCDAEMEKAELERLVQQLETQKNELMNYRLQKDSEIQRFQSENAILNDSFQRRMHEMETRSLEDRSALTGQIDALHQQLRQKEAELANKDVELQRLHNKDAEFVHMETRLCELMAKEATYSQNETNLQKLSDAEEHIRSCQVEMHRKETEFLQLKEEISAIQREKMTFEEEKSKMADEIMQLLCDKQVKEKRITDMEQEKQDLVDKVLELHTSLAERERKLEEFTQAHEDLNHRLEMAVHMQQELDKQKQENTVLQDKIEEMKTELLNQLAASDAQLRKALEEKDRDIERLKAQEITSLTTELLPVDHNATLYDVPKTEIHSEADDMQTESIAQTSEGEDKQ